jgi:nicotinamidase-related amidase
LTIGNDATKSEGNMTANRKTALVLIDVQVNMFEPDPVHDSKQLMPTLTRLLAQARQAHIPVIFVQNNGETGAPDEPNTPGWHIHPALAPTEDETVLQKEMEDAFYQTPLSQKLAELGVTRLIIAGLQTEMCVDTTIRAAKSRDYDVTLVADGHSTFDSPALTAVQIIAHHNDILTSFAHVIPTAEIDFNL